MVALVDPAVPPPLSINLGDLKRNNHSLILPRSVQNEEALYVIVWKAAPVHERLMRVVGGGGIVRFGSARKNYLRSRCRAALKALTWYEFHNAPPRSGERHSLIEWRHSSDKHVELKDLELIVVYGACANAAESLGVDVAVQVTDQRPPGNLTAVAKWRGRYWQKACACGGAEKLFGAFIAYTGARAFHRYRPDPRDMLWD